MYYCLSLALYMTLDEKQLEGQAIYCGSQIECAAHHVHSATTLVTSGPVGKQRAKDVGTQLVFFFVFSLRLQPLEWCY